jgi:hypothetical protein
MHFYSATRPGKPTTENEDWCAATSDLLVVLDGATVRTDTGCHHGIPWYTRKLGAGIIAAAAVRSTTLAAALSAAIAGVRELHPECNLDHPGTPSAGVGIVRWNETTLQYLVLGDVSVVIDTGIEVVEVSDQRVSQTASAERAEADRHLIGTPEKAAALVDMKHAELAARNVDGGYWIAAADPNAADHALYGELPRFTVRRLAVLSDGAARAVAAFDLFTSWSAALDAIEEHGPEEFIKLVRRTEMADPLGAHHPRNKASDDATVVYAGTENTAVEKLLAMTMNAPGIMGAEPRMPGWPTPGTTPEIPVPERDLSGLTPAQKLLAMTMNAPGIMGAEPRMPGWTPR